MTRENVLNHQCRNSLSPPFPYYLDEIDRLPSIIIDDSTSHIIRSIYSYHHFDDPIDRDEEIIYERIVSDLDDSG